MESEDLDQLFDNLCPYRCHIHNATQGGDVEAFHHLLQAAAYYLESGQPLPKALAVWVAKGLRGLITEDDVRKAFNVATKRGPRKRHLWEERFQIAQEIYYSGEGIHKGILADGSDGILTKAGEKYGLSADTVHRYFKEFKGLIEEEERLRKEGSHIE